MKKIINKKQSQYLIGLLFIITGFGHFLFTEFYVRIMPPYIPFHLEVVYLTGILEIIGGVSIFFRTYQKWVTYGLIVLLLAIFPANLYMAMNPKLFAEVPIWLLYLRLPLQFILIGWVYWSGNDTNTIHDEDH